MSKSIYVTKYFNTPILVDDNSLIFYEFNGSQWVKRHKIGKDVLKTFIHIGKIKE